MTYKKNNPRTQTAFVKNNLELISLQQTWQITILNKQVSKSRSLISLSGIDTIFFLQTVNDKYLSCSSKTKKMITTWCSLEKMQTLATAKQYYNLAQCPEKKLHECNYRWSEWWKQQQVLLFPSDIGGCSDNLLDCKPPKWSPEMTAFNDLNA